MGWGQDINKDIAADTSYQKGLDAAQGGDFAYAFEQWAPLAELGYVSAQNNLGMMYEKGFGVLQDYEVAINWYSLAAEKGFAPAQTNLGHIYRSGRGATQDYIAALRWYTRAAEQADGDAQFNLAAMYALGDGLPTDYIRAYMWGNLAALNGNNYGLGIRDEFAKQMTPSQIQKAQGLSDKCVKQNYLGC